VKTEIEIPSRLSYSSLSTYSECGQRWLLERGHGLNKSTWFATIAGSAIHTITEKIDLKAVGVYGGSIPTFKAEFDRRLDLEKRKGVEVKPSGRVGKTMSKTGGPNKKDYDWWLLFGPQFVDNWIGFIQDLHWELAFLPGGIPGVEVSLRQRMAGRDFLGFIDRVYVTPEGELVVVDLKSGNVPSSSLQLGTYRVGLIREHQLWADWGAYWMASDGELTPLKDLTIYTEEFIEAQYEMAWRGINAGVFLPNVTAMCKGCGVQPWCRAAGGRESDEIPVIHDMIPRHADES
jgi:hypothetical protein